MSDTSKTSLKIFSIIAFFGYTVVHGHRLNQDCWLCQYRGLAMVSGSMALGGYLAYLNR